MNNNVIKLHFHKSSSFLSKLIRWYTGSIFSHVSVEVNGRFYHSILSRGSFSVTEQFPDSVVNIPFTLSDKALDELLTVLTAMDGSRYDLLSIVGYVFKIKTNNKKRLYCSEMAALAIESICPYPIHNGKLILPDSIYNTAVSYKLGTINPNSMGS